MRITSLLAANADEILLECTSLTHGIDVDLEGDRQAKFESGEVDAAWVCGLLGTQLLADRVAGQIVLAPVFEGRSRPVYQSVIVARAGSGYASLADVAGATLAINDYGSWSGWHGLVDHLESHRRSVDLFSVQMESGGHVHSVKAVQNRDADVAAIDHSVWDWLTRQGRTEGLVAIDRTSPAPAPPIIVRDGVDPTPLMALIDADLGSIAGIERWERADPEAYLMFDLVES